MKARCQVCGIATHSWRVGRGGLIMCIGPKIGVACYVAPLPRRHKGTVGKKAARPAPPAKENRHASDCVID